MIEEIIMMICPKCYNIMCDGGIYPESEFKDTCELICSNCKSIVPIPKKQQTTKD